MAAAYSSSTTTSTRLVIIVLLLFLVASAICEEKEHVLTLDHSNFSQIVSHHNFIVVEFYAPWCGHCKNLAPEYEKAASILTTIEPPVILAKVDANAQENKELATQYEVQGFPTIKILRSGGTIVQEYEGPREADGIVDYLKKQAGPASIEINSAQDAGNYIDDKKIFVVGIFPKFSGEEYENFTILAEKLRSDFEFGHATEAKLLSRGESLVTKPTLRLLKPFDEEFIDSQDFQIDAMEKFIEESSTPLVTLFDQDPDNHPFLVKFFDSSDAKAMLFLNFSDEPADGLKSSHREAAVFFKGKGVSFLIGDLEASERALQYFGIKDDVVPVLIIQSGDGLKYIKSKVEPDQIAPWLKEYMAGNVRPFIKSEPIPETNDEPVKVVAADSIREMVLDSKKNVLLEFYAPWCGHCKKLAPILDEVAISYENDADIMIAKLDATENDIPNDIFDVQGYPTIYFRSASGNLFLYDGDRTKEEIIDFIQKNREGSSQESIAESMESKYDEL